MNQTIALIDDDRNILTSISMALEKEGFNVQTYLDGESALIGLSRNPPDLAVVDIKMPKMDGEELLIKLRKKTSLPVIFLTSYFLKFPEIKEYMNSTIKFCRKSGYVNNIFGRRTYIKGINDKNYNIRNFQERAAINAPIQGSASEIMRLAMIRLNKKFNDLKNNKSKMLLQIHDELIFEIPKGELVKICDIINHEMISVSKSDMHSFSIPLTVDINSGDNWGILH